MSSVESITEELAALSAAYETPETVQEFLRERDLVPLIGPFAVGKTTLMRAVELVDDDFGRVRSFTTRQRRQGEDDDTYDFLAHDITTLQRIHGQAMAHSLVQFTVHPTTGNVYGSAVDSYGTPYSMLDTMPSSLPGLESLPFRNIIKVGITTPPEVWESRMAMRLRHGDANDIRNRLTEGIGNITWSLDQGDNLAWVVNGSQDVSDVAVEFARTVRDGDVSNVQARNVAASLLGRMKELQEEA